MNYEYLETYIWINPWITFLLNIDFSTQNHVSIFAAFCLFEQGTRYCYKMIETYLYYRSQISFSPLAVLSIGYLHFKSGIVFSVEILTAIICDLHSLHGFYVDHNSNLNNWKWSHMLSFSTSMIWFIGNGYQQKLLFGNEIY